MQLNTKKILNTLFYSASKSECRASCSGNSLKKLWIAMEGNK